VLIFDSFMKLEGNCYIGKIVIIIIDEFNLTKLNQHCPKAKTFFVIKLKITTSKVIRAYVGFVGLFFFFFYRRFNIFFGE
jgi:hypothetical protein